MVLWHLWPLVFLWHSPLPSDFCRSSWVVTLSAESCHQSLAFVVWAQSRTQNRPRHTHSAVLRSGGGEEISAFVALMMPLILSGFPGLRAEEGAAGWTALVFEGSAEGCVCNIIAAHQRAVLHVAKYNCNGTMLEEISYRDFFLCVLGIDWAWGYETIS